MQQGYNIGPLLLLPFMNHLTFCSRSSKLLYGDSIKIFGAVKNMEDGVALQIKHAQMFCDAIP